MSLTKISCKITRNKTEMKVLINSFRFFSFNFTWKNFVWVSQNINQSICQTSHSQSHMARAPTEHALPPKNPTFFCFANFQPSNGGRFVMELATNYSNGFVWLCFMVASTHINLTMWSNKEETHRTVRHLPCDPCVDWSNCKSSDRFIPSWQIWDSIKHYSRINTPWWSSLVSNDKAQ